MRLIYFSPVPFASYGQRPHFLMRALAAANPGLETLWVEPYPTRWPRPSDLWRQREGSGIGIAPWAGLSFVKPYALPWEPMPGSGLVHHASLWKRVRATLRRFSGPSTVVAVGRPSKLALWAVRDLPARQRVFDSMDDFPEFYRGWSKWSFSATERKIGDECDLIVCSSQRLVEKWKARAPSSAVELVPNGYPMDVLPALPSRRQPRIGFVGTMAGWFDWDLLREMAQALPGVEFVLAGPVLGGHVGALPPNVRMQPACSVDDAVRLMASCTAGVIPFLRNSLTASVDPIKFYETRALGLPVWTTSFGAMSPRIGEPGIWGIAKGCDWRELWQQALAWQAHPAALEAFRREHDWGLRAQRLAGFLGYGRRSRPSMEPSTAMGETAEA